MIGLYGKSDTDNSYHLSRYFFSILVLTKRLNTEFKITMSNTTSVTRREPHVELGVLCTPPERLLHLFLCGLSYWIFSFECMFFCRLLFIDVCFCPEFFGYFSIYVLDSKFGNFCPFSLLFVLLQSKCLALSNKLLFCWLMLFYPICIYSNLITEMIYNRRIASTSYLFTQNTNRSQIITLKFYL